MKKVFSWTFASIRSSVDRAKWAFCLQVKSGECVSLKMSAELDSADPIASWNFKWVIKGELAIMGCPKSKENIKHLVDNGITHLVSLSPEKQPPFEYFPFHFRWTPIDVLEFEAPTMEQIIAFINTCKVAVFNKEVGLSNYLSVRLTVFK